VMGDVARVAIELTVVPSDDGSYSAIWSDGDLLFAGVPETWIDLMGFMAARVLLRLGYDRHA